MKAIKLSDIAKKLNVSTSTVSKAMGEYSDIKKETKKKILEYVKKVNFRPNTIAASLKTKKTKTIGIIIPDMQNLFFTKIINAIVDNASSIGYKCILMCSNESYEEEMECIDRLINANVEAIVISLTNRSVEYSHLEKVKEADIILIQFDKISKIVKSSTVTTNNIDAAFELTQKLIDSGKRRIAHFRGGYISQVSIDRFIGYQKALEKNEITFDKDLILSIEKGTSEDAELVMQEMIDKRIDFDAVFAIDDKTASGVIKCLSKNNFKIPEEVAVVGFSNAEYSKYLTPSLSSFDQSSEQFGREIIKTFIKEEEIIKTNTEYNFSQVKIPAYFVRRESF